MPTLNIGGVPVEFPKEPYECQITYMDKVIQALNHGKNALLESPTGTGKTLCLLCSSLAWQDVQKKQINVERISRKQTEISGNIAQQVNHQQPQSIFSSTKNAVHNAGAVVDKDPHVSLILYATRTHSQLKQVVNELRNTGYMPKMTVLGSRDQLCINDKFSKLKGSVKNHACNTLNANKGKMCEFKRNLDLVTDFSLTDAIELLDIEDTLKLGAERSLCPYFYTKKVASSSEIIFMPYNYLLDPTIRNTLGEIAWNNSIVIFDEAHNLEKVASDAASYSFNSVDLAACIKELQQILLKLKEIHEFKKYENDNESSKDGSKSSSTDLKSTEPPSLPKAASLLNGLFALERIIDDLPLQKSISGGEELSTTLPGQWLLETLSNIGVCDIKVSP